MKKRYVKLAMLSAIMIALTIAFFVPSSIQAGTTPVLDEGTYVISSALDENMVIDVSGVSYDSGANVQLWESLGVTSQQFQLDYLGNDSYQIIAAFSGKALDVAGMGTSDGTNVWQWEANLEYAQTWQIQSTGDGYYRIVDLNSGKALSAAGSSAVNGVNLQLETISDSAAQKFKFTQKTSSELEVLSEGTYVISPSFDQDMCLDVAGVSYDNGANIQLWEQLGLTSQQFELVYLGDGTYQIIASVAGRAVDVSGMGQTDDTNIWQWESNLDYAQTWLIQPTYDGYYTIIDQNSGKALSASDESSYNGNNIKIWDLFGGSTQKFTFSQVSDDDLMVLEEGTYTISAKDNSNAVLDVSGVSFDNGGNVQIWEDWGLASQQFELEYQGNGNYKIISVYSGKALDVYGSKTDSGTNVWQWEESSLYAQTWKIQKTLDGSYTLRDVNSGKMLDMSNSSTSNGTNVQIWDANGSSAQSYNFTELTDSDYQLVTDGVYAIRSAINSNMGVDVSCASLDSGANVQIWEYLSYDSQQFYFTYQGDGYYKITNYASDMVLDVSNSGTDNGTNIQQYESNGSDAQKWRILNVGGGNYVLQSKCNGQLMTIASSDVVNAVNLETWENTGSSTQKFSLEKIAKDVGWATINGRKVYMDSNGEIISKTGIDVSAYQGSIDWESVQADGIDYAIIRVGLGNDETSQDDTCAAYNISECERLGIPYGIYFVTYAMSDDEVQSEISHLRRLISQTGANPTMGVYVDVEVTEYYEKYGWDNMYDHIDELTGYCVTIMDAMSSDGYTAGIYANYNYFCNYLDISQFGQYKWLAAYYDEIPSGDWYMWQYTSGASVAGISGSVDMNILIGL